MFGFDGAAAKMMWVSGFLHFWELVDIANWTEAFACPSGQAV